MEGNMTRNWSGHTNVRIGKKTQRDQGGDQWPEEGEQCEWHWSGHRKHWEDRRGQEELRADLAPTSPALESSSEAEEESVENQEEDNKRLRGVWANWENAERRQAPESGRTR